MRLNKYIIASTKEKEVVESPDHLRTEGRWYKEEELPMESENAIYWLRFLYWQIFIFFTDFQSDRIFPFYMPNPLSQYVTPYFESAILGFVQICRLSSYILYFSHVYFTVWSINLLFWNSSLGNSIEFNIYIIVLNYSLADLESLNIISEGTLFVRFLFLKE